MSKSRNRAIFLVGIAIAGLGLLIYCCWPPPMPREWAALSIGMTHDEVVRVLPDRVHDMRDLKGYDIAFRESRILGARYTWRVFVFYGNDGRVKSIDASTANQLCGCLDQRAPTIGE